MSDQDHRVYLGSLGVLVGSWRKNSVVKSMVLIASPLGSNLDSTVYVVTKRRWDPFGYRKT